MSKKSLPFDMTKFKKTGGDKNTTVLTHNDGHTITLAHHALSPEMRKQIESVPMSDGGDVKPKFGNAQEEQNAKDISKGAQSGDSLEGVKQGFKNAWDQVSGAGPQNAYAKGGNVKSNKYNPKLVQSKKEPGTPMIEQQSNASQQPQNYAFGTDDVQNSSSTQQPEANNSQMPGAVPTPAPTQDDPSPDLAKDPEQAQLRSIYNNVMSGTSAEPNYLFNAKNEQVSGNLAKVGTPNADQAQDAQFGPNGEFPKNFNVNAWAKTKQIRDNQKAQEASSTGIQTAALIEQNKARIEAGGQPLPIPGVPQNNQPPKPDATDNTNNRAPDSSIAKSTEDAYGLNGYAGAINTGVNQSVAGIKGEAAAQGALGQEESGLLGKQVDAQQQLMDQTNQHIADSETEYNNFVNDVQNQHIDPQHYLNSQGTAGRIATAVGLLVGGIGSGALGRENPALKMLNMQIDRDIDAQKANLGKSENLLSANLRHFGNIKDAAAMTQAMQTGIVISKLKQAEASAQDPMAKARAQQAAGALYMDKVAPALRQIGLNQMMMSIGNTNDPDKALHAAQAMRAMGNNDMAKSLEERAIPGVGMAEKPVPTEAVNNMIGIKNVNDLFNRSLEFSQQHAGSWNPATMAQASTIQKQLIGSIKQAQHDGVYKDSEAQYLLGQIGGDPSSVFAKISSIPKIKELQAIKQQEYGQLLRTYGIKNGTLPGAQDQSANQPVVRQTKDGKSALFDPTTKKFLGYK